MTFWCSVIFITKRAIKRESADEKICKTFYD